MQNNHKIPVLSNLVELPGLGGGHNIWYRLLLEGQQLMIENQSTKPLVVIEIGANDLIDATTAAKYGLEIHSIEPSPKAFKKMVNGIQRRDVKIRDKIWLYNYLVGDEDDQTLFFDNSGSTGAAVLSEEEAKHHPAAAQVTSLKMDTFFQNAIKPTYNSLPHSDFQEDIYAVKVDVQGYEPAVFHGMKNAIQSRKIQYILTEFDPSLIEQVNNYPDKCRQSIQFLTEAYQAGYIIYAGGLTTHANNPHSGVLGQEKKIRLGRPFEDLYQDCMFLYKLENGFFEEDKDKDKEKEEYHHHYWTDYLLIAPGAPFPKKPATRLFAQQLLLKNKTW